MLIREIFPSAAIKPYTPQQLQDTAKYCRDTATQTIPLEAGKYELTISNDGSYRLFAQDHFIGYANVSNTSLGTLQYGSVNLIYLVPEARKTKAFLIFVNALRHVIAKPILVDGSVFKDGAEALKAMAKRHLFTVRVIDKNTGELSPYDGTVPQDHDKAIVVEGLKFPIGGYYPLPCMSPTDPSCYNSFVWFED